ncbi:sn-glycerol-3-phosphate transporter [Sansalvadorimonas sp. 2012CJ34-2]|uniref:Sn-glycerol-3-phosphate transporter n=1 Tax=Parendozoicomonas callyspongiae TaxID=2942213 RepID=A0ABT0PDI7_9GAMM|nr:sn-glycerol-3-phosphate transporter [Sansalvadorimonas sp. 2012CJ34-2]MCL6269448.1 sn-glycerol-3-phosphate transporter [Sansalvadorimonas sp. 2012CJ34-2]
MTVSRLLIVLNAALLILSGVAKAEPDKTLYLQTSLYTKHFHTNKYHNDKQELISLEWFYPAKSSDLLGATTFRNSFNQRCEYLYWGRQYPLSNIQEGMRAKVTLGLLHGYKGKHQNSIPLNNFGTAPAVIPTIGYENRYFGVDVIMLGVSAVMLTVGVSLGK